MIQNPEILKKLEEKTRFDPTLHNFIKKLLEGESEGKSLKRICDTEIEKTVRHGRGGEG